MFKFVGAPRPKSTQANITDSFKDSESEFPLHASICNNNLATLQQLLNSPEAADLLSTGDGFWGAPLHVAIYCDSVEAVDLLLEAGANVAAKSFARDDRMSPLALAAHVGNRRLLWRLWKHICPRDHAESIQNVDSCLVEAAMSGQVPMLGALLDWWDGWTAEAKNQALCWAARRWKLYSVQFLLSKLSFGQQALDDALAGAVDFKFLLGTETYIDYEGVDYFQQQLLVALLVDAGANTNTAMSGQSTVLWAARRVNLVGVLKVLLEKGANPNATDETGKTALHFVGSPNVVRQNGSIRRLNETAIHLLLRHGASIYQQDNESGATPLHAAAFGLTLNMLQLYLSSCPSQDRDEAMRFKNHRGETLLHYAAAGAKADIVEFLITQGFHVNHVNSNGWTPLHCALTPTSQGSQLDSLPKKSSEAIKTAKLLLSHGADPLSVTAEGWTPLHCLALFAGRKKKKHDELTQFVNELMLRGADVEGRATFIFWNPLGDKEPMDYCWGHQVQDSIRDPESCGVTIRFGYTPLHFAAAYGSTNLAKALLEHGADPLSKDARGNSAIKIATHSLLLDDFPKTRQAMIKLMTDSGTSSQSRAS